jgi:rhodanese-related sulfurtransferase
MDSKAADTIAIVDVRDSDHIGGHIRSSINVPSTKFLSKMPKLEAALQNRQRVVFHCQLSQQRGPTCAAAYCKHLNGKGLKNQEVYVLSGGFNEWARHYGPDKRYTESFRPELYP